MFTSVGRTGFIQAITVLWILCPSLTCGQESSSKRFSIALNPAGDVIAQAGRDGRLLIWSIDGTLRSILDTSFRHVDTISFSPRGNIFAVAGQHADEGQSIESQIIEIRDGITFDIVNKIFLSKNCQDVLVRPDGKTLMLVDEDGTFSLLSADEDEISSMFDLSTSENQVIDDIPFPPDSRIRMAYNSNYSYVLITAAETERTHYAIINARTGATKSFALAMTNLVAEVSTDGRTFAATVQGAVNIDLLDIVDGRPLGRLIPKLSMLNMNEDDYRASGVLIAGESPEKRLRRIEKHRRKKETPIPSPVRSISFSNDGMMLASGTAWGQINLYDTSTQELVRQLRTPDAYAVKLLFNPNDEYLVANLSNRTIAIYKIKEGVLVRTLINRDN